MPQQSLITISIVFLSLFCQKLMSVRCRTIEIPPDDIWSYWLLQIQMIYTFCAAILFDQMCEGLSKILCLPLSSIFNWNWTHGHFFERFMKFKRELASYLFWNNNTWLLFIWYLQAYFFHQLVALEIALD